MALRNIFRDLLINYLKLFVELNVYRNIAIYNYLKSYLILKKVDQWEYQNQISLQKIKTKWQI